MKSFSRKPMTDVGALVESIVEEGPPEATAYGTENVARYVHTLGWLAQGLRRPGARVLDVGVYPGHLARALVRLAGAEVRGVGRFVPAAFGRWMRERGIPVDEVNAERELLPYPSASFDGVVATEVLEHVDNPLLLLSECLRVLVRGGSLFVSTPNLLDLRGRLRAVVGRSPQSHLFGIERPFRMNEWVHRREYTVEEVARMMRAVGFADPAIHTWTPTRSTGRASRVAWVTPLLNCIPGVGGTIFATATKPAAAGSRGETDIARIRTTCEYLETRPAATAGIPLEIENVGTSCWASGTAPGRVLAGAHLLAVGGQMLDRDLARAALPCDVAPGAAIAVRLEFRAPAQAGVYLVEIDLVREGEHWFGDDGSPSARIAVKVG